MNPILLEGFNDFASGINFQVPTESVTTQAINFVSNPTVLVAAVILIVVTIFLLFFLKKIMINSILGGLIWGASIFFFHVELPLIPSFVISIMFGPAGIGAMLLLKFFGLLA
ncbi:MAG: hypothetical protein WC821_03210 [archaeon]|jgi:hypothetical protein